MIVHFTLLAIYYDMMQNDKSLAWTFKKKTNIAEGSCMFSCNNK